MNSFNQINAGRNDEPYMSPDEIVEKIQKHLYDKNGLELYRYAGKLMNWIRNNYNVEPTDYNGGCADGSTIGCLTAYKEAETLSNISTSDLSNIHLH